MEFGEIVTQSTRAFWDDYEDSVILPLPELKWTWSNGDDETSSVAAVDTFLILEGTSPGSVQHFANQTILQRASPICSVPGQKVQLYLIKSENLAICITETTDLNLFSSIAELLQPFVNRPEQKVLTINFQSNVTHKGTPADDQDRFCFVRGINSKLSTVQELQEPNILTGVSAGVVSWREHCSLPFSAYIVYLDMPDFDRATAATIVELITKLGIRCSGEFSNRITSLNDSNLYT